MNFLSKVATSVALLLLFFTCSKDSFTPTDIDGITKNNTVSTETAAFNDLINQLNAHPDSKKLNPKYDCKCYIRVENVTNHGNRRWNFHYQVGGSITGFGDFWNPEISINESLPSDYFLLDQSYQNVEGNYFSISRASMNEDDLSIDAHVLCVNHGNELGGYYRMNFTLSDEEFDDVDPTPDSAIFWGYYFNCHSLIYDTPF